MKEEAFLPVLEALKINGCIAGFTKVEGEFIPDWLPGGVDRAGAELLCIPRPFRLKKSQSGYLMLLLPIEKRRELDSAILAGIRIRSESNRIENAEHYHWSECQWVISPIDLRGAVTSIYSVVMEYSMSIAAGEFEMALLAELRLGLPPTFYFRLVEIEDDWAFVLKMHSFFEGTLTHLLQEKLRLRTQVQESLTPRDSFVSRVHLASRMDLMEPDYRGFLLGLNRLRNEITHNIRFIAFDLQSYVDRLSDVEFRRTAVTLCAGFKNVPADPFLKHLSRKNARPRQCRTVREVFWHVSPKLSLWNAGVWTLDLISLHFHFEWSGETPVLEGETEAKLQDLLHDPTVLEYRRRHSRLWPSENG
jgi:hypothetical protein